MLWTGSFRDFLAYTFKFYISGSLCSLHVFTFFLSCQFSSWLLVAANVDRFLYVISLDLSKKWCTKSNAIRISLIIFICLGLMNVHFLLFVKSNGLLLEHPNSTQSNAFNKTNTMALINPLVYPLCHYVYSTFFMNYTWLDSFIYSFIPFIIILICNVALIHKVISTKRNIARNTKKSNSDDNKNKQVLLDKKTLNDKEYLEDNELLSKIYLNEKPLNIATVNSNHMDRLKYMAFTILGVTFLFIIFTMPINIYLPIMQLKNANGGKPDKTQRCNDDLIFHILNNMVNCNHSINFFIYLTTNTKFKNEINAILKEIMLFLTTSICHKNDSSNTLNPNNEANSRVSTFTFTKNTSLTNDSNKSYLPRITTKFI